MTNEELKTALITAGDKPGPITATTRKTYEIRLVKLKQNPTLAKTQTGDKLFPKTFPPNSSSLSVIINGNLCIPPPSETQYR